MSYELLNNFFYNLLIKDRNFYHIPTFPDVLPHEIIHPDIIIWLNSKSQYSLYAFLFVLNSEPNNIDIADIKPELNLVLALKNNLDEAIGKLKYLISEFCQNFLHEILQEFDFDLQGYNLELSNVIEEDLSGAAWYTSLYNYKIGKVLYITEMFEKNLHKPATILSISLEKICDIIKIYHDCHKISDTQTNLQNNQVYKCEIPERNIRCESILYHIINEYFLYLKDSVFFDYLQKISNLSMNDNIENTFETFFKDTTDEKLNYWKTLELLKMFYLLENINCGTCKYRLNQIRTSIKKVVKKRISEFCRIFSK